MKKKIILCTALVAITAATAVAQDGKATVYGYRNESYNLRFCQPEKTHTEISFGAHYALKDVPAVGLDVQAARVYTPQANFAWQWGGLLSEEYAFEHYRSMADILGVCGIRFGRGVALKIDALAGAGQYGWYLRTTNGQSFHHYYSTKWAGKVGGQAAVQLRLADGVRLSVFGRYLRTLTDCNVSYVGKDGWEADVDGKFVQMNKLAVGGTLSFDISKESRSSGDACWQLAAVGGYDLKQRDFAAGVELYRFRRLDAKNGVLYGCGAEEIFGDVKTNQVYGKAGYQFFACGARTFLVPEVGVKVGMRDYVKFEQAEASDGSYYRDNSLKAVAAMGAVYAGVNFHFGKLSLKLAAEANGYLGSGTNYAGKDVSYDGTTSGCENWGIRGIFGVSFAL